MDASTPLRLQVLTGEPEGSPRGALVLIHGRGADERDLLPLARQLDPERRLLWAFPRGPFPLGPGACWYHFGSVGQPEPDSFLQAKVSLQRWLAEFLREREFAGERLVVGGFSQGATMSYVLGLDRDNPRPAGVLALSGYLPDFDAWRPTLERARDLHVLIQHGEQDPLVEAAWSRSARERLENAGARVRHHLFDGGHWVDPEGVDLARSWLQEVLGPVGA